MPSPPPIQIQSLRSELRAALPALLGGLLACGLMLVWAIQDGGYDPSTWYWGALAVLAALVLTVGSGVARLRVTRPAATALAAFALYVAWSYASIAWAGSQGNALEGSNRALLYLMVFALLAVLPWTPRAALIVLVTFALGVGLIALVLLWRMASGDNVETLFDSWRLLAPTGYFNATVALFTTGALLALALASRRALPGLLRGTLVALAVADLQLAVVGQSRGWLFTLPLVVIATAVVCRERIRLAGAGAVAAGATALTLHRLLAVYQAHLGGTTLGQAARSAGHSALLVCAGTLAVFTLIAWGDALIRLPALGRRGQRLVGTAVLVLVLAAGAAGALRVTHGDPAGFVKRQWNGFRHPSAGNTGASYFNVVGSGRYDFWRVSLQAFGAHPLRGLGQDNFPDYYITRRRTVEEPQWTHSLEMRLLAHTGVVGTLLFTVFLVAALVAAARVRRGGDPQARWLAGAALLPLIVWLLHGSVDWFWEMPALSGPALGFLALAGALPASGVEPRAATESLGRWLRLGVGTRRTLWGLSGAAALVLVAVLGLPYLSVREMTAANAARDRNPGAALADLDRAATLNPLSADPGRVGGALALQVGDFTQAQRRFHQAVQREPGGWFSWLGEGLAASALGDNVLARQDFDVAGRINSRQPAVRQARARVNSTRPLTPAQAFSLLVLAQ